MYEASEFSGSAAWLLANEAVKRGLGIEFLFPDTVDGKKRGALALSFEGKTEYILGDTLGATSAFAYKIQKNKDFTKLLLNKAGVTVSKGEVIKKGESVKALKIANTLGYPLVVKPISGTHGTDVFMGVDNDNFLQEILAKIDGDVLLEEQFLNGRDYRLLVVGDKLIAAAERLPANVIGDGMHTINELVTIKNSEPVRSKNPLIGITKLKLNEESLRILKSYGYSGASVPAINEVVPIRKTSNISQGGDTIDVTDIVHPSVVEIAVRAAQAIPGLVYAGLDFMTNTSISQEQNDKSYVMIEVNGSPMFSIHHFPYEGTPRNVAGAVLDYLFPKTKLIS